MPYNDDFNKQFNLTTAFTTCVQLGNVEIFTHCILDRENNYDPLKILFNDANLSNKCSQQ